MAHKKILQDKIKKHSIFLLFCLLFFITGFCVAHAWYRFLLNPDASSYFSIAQKYAHFNIKHAINGYWGPLLSWLLVPAVWLHLDLFMAARVIALCASIGILAVVYAFLLSRNISKKIVMIAVGVLGAILLEASAAESITPDILLTLLVTLFAVTLIDFLQKPRRSHSIILGIIGALMYYAKGFGLYLFIAVIASAAVWEWLVVEKKIGAVCKRFFPVAITFVLLILPFVTAVSIKYQRITVNTAGAFDHALFGPVSKGLLYPMITAGPIVPPVGAISSWEDPTNLTPLIPGTGWSPLSSKANLKYFIVDVLGHNLNRTVSFIYAFGPFIAAGFLLLFLGLLQDKYRREFVVFSVISSFMILGYSLVLVEARYLYSVAVLATMGAALWIGLAEKAKIINRLQIIIGGSVIVLLGFLLNFQTIIAMHDATASRNYTILLRARSDIPAHANIISDTFSSYDICYHFTLTCYGILTPPLQNEADYYSHLKSLNIKYFVDFHTRDNDENLKKFVNDYYIETADRPINVSTGHITIYRIRP